MYIYTYKKYINNLSPLINVLAWGFNGKATLHLTCIYKLTKIYKIIQVHNNDKCQDYFLNYFLRKHIHIFIFFIEPKKRSVK